MLGASALGQASPDELARRHFESGEAYLAESDYDHALEAFEKAYDLSKRPELLINIATVHERLGNLPAAIAALRGYLEHAPEGEHRATVELRIANLEKRLPAQTDAGAPDAAATQPPPVPPPGVAVTQATPPPATAVPPPNDDSGDSNVAALVVLAIGGVAAGGAVLTGVLASGEYDDARSSCSPGCTDSQLSTGRSMALTSTVLTGVAIVGVAVGATMLLTGGSGDGSADRAGRFRGVTAIPRVDLAIGPRAAGADATWSF